MLRCNLQVGGEDAEIYRNRKCIFSINVQVVGGPNLKIQDIVARWPGSTHDAVIFNNSRILGRFDAGEFVNSVLLGDMQCLCAEALFVNTATQPCNKRRAAI